MLKLAKDFYIISVFSTDSFANIYLPRFKRYKYSRFYTYRFLYKNYQIVLDISFCQYGYIKDSNLAIINFGYAVYIKKWSNKKQDYYFIDDVDYESGKSTKRYLDSQEARELILRFIEKRIDKYLKRVSPPILIRGAMDEVKINLPRYKRLDKQFFKHGYIKKEFDVKRSQSLYNLITEKSDDDKEIWVYSKDEALFNRLDEVEDRDDM